VPGISSSTPIVRRSIQDPRRLAVDAVKVDRAAARNMIARLHAKQSLKGLRQRVQSDHRGREVFLGRVMLVVQVQLIREQLQPAQGLKGHAPRRAGALEVESNRHAIGEALSMGRAARVPDPSPSGGAATLARNSNFERLAQRLTELELEHCGRPVPRTLLKAILSGDRCLVTIFLRNQPDALHEPVNDQGWTPLLVAINRGHFAMAEFFVQAGADVNRANSAGETPLYHAVAKGSQALVRCLLAAGADPAV